MLLKPCCPSSIVSVFFLLCWKINVCMYVTVADPGFAKGGTDRGERGAPAYGGPGTKPPSAGSRGTAFGGAKGAS